MAAPARDIETLERNLVDCAHVEWVVTGKAIVALFPPSGSAKYTDYHREYLGRPSLNGNANSSLRLWVGINEKTKQVLVALTQRIRMTRANKHRLFFLCLPTDFVTLDVADPAVWRLSDGTVPSRIEGGDKSNAHANQMSRLLRMSFDLGKQKSWVIMPEYPHTGTMSSGAMSTLRKLKTLSEASAFDLFTNHDSWFQRAMLKTRQLLETNDVSRPAVQYANFYPDGRSAVVDRWDLQGWYDAKDDTDEDGQNTTRNLLKRKHVAMSPQPEEVPPAYSPPAAPQPDPASPPAALAPSRVSEALNVMHHTMTTVPATTVQAMDGSEFDDSLLGHFVESPRSNPPVSGSSAQIAVARKPPSLPTSCEFPHSPVRAAAHHVAICVERTPESDSLPTLALHKPNTVARAMSLIPETPMPTFAQPAPSPRNSIRRITPGHALRLLSLQSLVPWLVELWKRWPCAHYICIVQLLQIGVASNDCNVDLYHTARARALTTLLDSNTTDQLERPLVTLYHIATRRRFVESGIYELISWLLILHPDADLKFCNQLSDLAALEDRTRHLTDAEPEGTDRYHRLLRSFSDLKAQIVLDACKQFGDAVLDQDGHVASKMLAEKRRIDL